MNAQFDPMSLADPAVGDLVDDGVAFVDTPSDPILLDQLRGALVQHAQATADHAGIVVVGPQPATSAQMRDVAQELLNSTDLTTVVVRSPESAAAVSETYSRAAIETAQMGHLYDPDYVQGLSGFLTSVSDFSLPWAAISLVGAIVALIVIAVTALSVKSH